MAQVAEAKTWPRIAVGRRYEQRPGGEIRIYEGFGRVEELKLKNGQRNGHVVIKADHLAQPVQGWLDSTSPLWAIVEAARAAGARVAYRIILERRRPKRGQAPIDPTIPIEGLDAQKQCTSKVEFVFVVNGDGEPTDAPPEGWELEGVAATVAAPASASAPEPAPEPAEPEPEPAPEPEPEPAAPVAAPVAEATQHTEFPQDPDGPPLCPLCGKTTVAAGPVRKIGDRFGHQACIAAGAGAGDAPTAPEGGAGRVAQRSAPAGRPGPRIAEGKPWERTNSDGSVNLGSFAIQASLGMVELSFDLCRDHRADVGEDQPPPIEQVRGLAARLLAAADRCQQTVRADGHFDRADNSHTRCRGAVRSALQAYPVPWGGEVDALKAARDQWVCNLADYAAGMILAAIELDR